MALTDNKAQRGGWRQQAERLAHAHTGLAATAMAASEQARRPLPEPILRHYRGRDVAIERTREAGASEPTPPGAQETDVTWALNAHGETLAARALRAVASDKRVAELENELATAREKLGIQENEIRDLRKSLDVLAGENPRLSDRLAENSTVLEWAKSQLERMQLALTAAETERDEANKLLEAETATLTTRFEAMSIRCVAAERLLAKARHNLLMTVTEKKAVEFEVAGAVAARDEVDQEFARLQSALQAKERRIQELEQSRSKLVDDINRLLRTSKTRDTALFRAEEKIGLLTELFAQLEIDGSASKMRIRNEGRSSRPPREPPGRDDFPKQTRTIHDQHATLPAPFDFAAAHRRICARGA